MSLRGTFSLARLAPIALLAWQAVTPTVAYSREVFKVTMEDVLKEMNKMRQDLRELKIQRDRDQRVIEELRQIVENSIPDLPVEGPHPSVALPSEEAPKPATAAPVHIAPPPTAGGGPAVPATAEGWHTRRSGTLRRELRSPVAAGAPPAAAAPAKHSQASR